MRRAVHIVALLLAVVVGFGAGYYYQTVHASSSAEMEDYALSNVLEDVGQAQYMWKGDTTNMRELLDVQIDAHLSRVRTHQGAIDDPVFEAAKVRTLNAVADLWALHPPFTTEQWQENDTNRSWWGEWQQTRTKNMELLRWAKNECATRPALRCKGAAAPAMPASQAR